MRRIADTCLATHTPPASIQEPASLSLLGAGRAFACTRRAGG